MLMDGWMDGSTMVHDGTRGCNLSTVGKAQLEPNTHIHPMRTTLINPAAVWLPRHPPPRITYHSSGIRSIARFHAANPARQRTHSTPVVCRRGGRSTSRRPPRDDDDLQYALRVLSRDWPRLVLPAAAGLVAISIVGPMLLSAAMLAIAVAGISAFFAAPMLLGLGAAMTMGGLVVASTIGFAGLYILPTLLSLVAVGAGAWIGSRLVTDYVSGGRSREEDNVVEAEFTDSPRDYDAWTGRSQRATVDDELDRMQREAAEDLKTFDQMMKLKDRMRGRD